MSGLTLAQLREKSSRLRPTCQSRTPRPPEVRLYKRGLDSNSPTHIYVVSAGLKTAFEPIFVVPFHMKSSRHRLNPWAKVFFS